jgi:Zn-dependent protease with chaperone function
MPDFCCQSRVKAVFVKAVVLMMTVSLLAPESFARFDPKPASPNFYSLDQEVQAGQQAAAEIDRKMPLVTDPQLNRYIQDLGRRLVAVAPGPKYPYTFKIVNEKDINAFALPGGPIHVNLGTIQAADNEAQLAGVIAHEMGHVIMRHSTHMASQQAVGQLGLGILGALIGRGTAGQLAQAGLAFGVNSVFMKYSRDAESQADLVGTDIMHDAGYDPIQLAKFFQKLDESGGSRGPQFFSDHPNPGNRVQSVSAEAATLPRENYRTDSQQFQAAKEIAMGMHPYTAQQIAQMEKSGVNPNNGNQSYGNGSGRNRQEQAAGRNNGSYDNDVPEQQYQSLNHRDFTMQYPADWRAYGDANSEVTIAPQNGIVREGNQDAVAYGVIISGFQPENRDNNPNNQFDEGTHQIIDQLRQSNPDMRTTSREENFTVDGAKAKSIMLMGTSPLTDQQGRTARERDWLVTVQRNDGTILYMVFIAPDQDFSQLRPQFEHMVRTFKVR